MTSPIQAFFKNYADALMSFSAEQISDFYQTPLAIYSDNGIRMVTDQADVLSFWKEGVKPYKGMHIEKASPKILIDDQLSEKIFTAKVFWSNADASGKEVAKETNFYILSQNPKGLKISGLILMTQ